MENEIIKEVDKLDVFDKMRVYWHWYVKMLVVRNNYSFENLYTRKDKFMEYGFDTETILGVRFKKLKPFTIGRKIPNSFFEIMAFDEFTSKDRVKHVDIGEKWKEQGFAQQKWIQLGGIYDYYPKFKHEIFQ